MATEMKETKCTVRVLTIETTPRRERQTNTSSGVIWHVSKIRYTLKHAFVVWHLLKSVQEMFFGEKIPEG